MDNPQISLMRNDQSKIATCKSVALENLDRQLAHATHGIFENLGAFLMHVMHPFFDSFLRGRLQRTAGWHVEIASARAIHVMNEIQNAFVSGSGRFHENRTGTIAKENAGGAVLVIEDGSHHVAADN